MAQSAVVRDYRALAIGRRRANRLVLTVSGWGPCRGRTRFCRPGRVPPVLVWIAAWRASPAGNVGRRVRARKHRRNRDTGLCAPRPPQSPLRPYRRF